MRHFYLTIIVRLSVQQYIAFSGQNDIVQHRGSVANRFPGATSVESIASPGHIKSPFGKYRL